MVKAAVSFTNCFFQQDLNQNYTSAQDSGVPVLRKTTLSYYHDNGYSTFPSLPLAIPYQHPPVPLPAAPTQGISDISPKLHAIRCDERRQNDTFSDDIQVRECAPLCNFPHMNPQAMTSNYKSPRNPSTDGSDVPVSVFDKLGPEVNNRISDNQTGLDDTHRRAPFREPAENMYNKSTFSNGNQFFSDGALTHDSRNKDKVRKTTTANTASGGESSRHVIVSLCIIIFLIMVVSF